MTNQLAPQELHLWVPHAPKLPGNYHWRSAKGTHEYPVEVFADWGKRGEIDFAWLCYEMTGFAEMTAGGEWQFVSENRVGRLRDGYVAGLANDASNWSTEAPTEDGRYLWRADENHPPVLIKVHTGVSLRTGNEEQFVTSYAHYLPEEFEALFRAGQWTPVSYNQPW
jgi:hypothetical protein